MLKKYKTKVQSPENYENFGIDFANRRVFAVLCSYNKSESCTSGKNLYHRLFIFFKAKIDGGCHIFSSKTSIV